LGVRDGGGGGRRREDDSRRAEPGSSMDGTIELYTGIQRLRISGWMRGQSPFTASYRTRGNIIS
jgi:hypothetical protein